MGFGVRIQISRFVDEHQPGWVECSLTDVDGQVWKFIEKIPVVTATDLWADSDYPQAGQIACQVVERRSDDRGNDVVVIDTELPWGVEATSGETRFNVRPEQLIEL